MPLGSILSGSVPHLASLFNILLEVTTKSEPINLDAKSVTPPAKIQLEKHPSQ